MAMNILELLPKLGSTVNGAKYMLENGETVSNAQTAMIPILTDNDSLH